MCGICGVVNLKGAPIDPDLPGQMINQLRHRGPDDAGVFVDSQVGFGHARLSIIDLSGGRQPMPDSQRAHWITFNGEIFNYVELTEELISKGHQFATHSDTEVILHLYQEEGEKCVERLNGQWAFAIWDATQQKLFLSRDRLGVRPLFYTQTLDRFLFASEMKALMACPEVQREIDLHALDQIFTFWATLPPRTPFKNIWQLPPGHSMVVQGGQVRVWPYWHLDYAPESELGQGSEEKLTEELLALLLDATRIRLRADVPVGAYLSGGLDSTFVTALAKRLVGHRLKTFSVSFSDPQFDEGAYQREAVAFLGTEHYDVHCANEDIAKAFPEVIWHAEQPILRTAPAPLFMLSKLARDNGFKVVLTGEGSDEIMGGYDIFKETKIRCFWQRQPRSSWRPLLLRRLYPYMESIQRSPLVYLQSFYRIDDQSPGPFFSHLPRWQLTAKTKMFFSTEAKSALGAHDVMDDMRGMVPAHYHAWEPFLQAQFLEADHLLPGYILSSQGDRMAMAHGVEGRYPFLDHRVVDFASRLPVRLKMKVLQEKYLLKRCAEGLIPRSVQARTKQPYRAPDGLCFLEPAAREYRDELLSTASLKGSGIFEPGPVAKLLEKFRSGRPISMKDNMALVGIISTQLVFHQFVEGFGRSHCNADPARVTAVRN
jgi:asparagine synthase (glutamine-hydrolysing)